MKVFFLILLILTADLSFSQSASGRASYYANKFEGRKTASGEIFSNKKMTAAHKTLPFGTIVRVITADSVQVVVTINDRLPASSTRIIDLSQAAAIELGFLAKGVIPVTIEVLPDDDL